MKNIKLLNKVLDTIKRQKAGKQLINDFEQFIYDFADTSSSFHLICEDSQKKLTFSEK